MKRTISIISMLAIIVFLFEGCQKTPISLTASNRDPALIQAAKEFFEVNLQGLPPIQTNNLRLNATKVPDWGAAYCVHFSQGPAVVVPLLYQMDLVVNTSFSGMQILPLNQLTKLVIYKDGLSYQSQVVTLFPDSNWRNRSKGTFSGFAFIEGWQGQHIKKYKYSQNIILKETDSNYEIGSSKKISASISKQIDGVIADCGAISGYNYSADNPSEIYSWSESVGCNYSYISDPEGPGLIPSEIPQLAHPPIPLATIVINPPSNIIANISDYLKCFSNYGGNDHTYQVTVCVDQPVPGTREAWAVSSPGVPGFTSGQNPVDAGHTFLVLTENFSGYSIVRNVGFYPQTSVYPWASSAQGQLGDDDTYPYNISLTITVDNGQFFNILNYISQGNNSGYLYNLSTNNCTSFSLHALEAGDIDLPATVGSWPGGGFGYDPGDLGEDIRNMVLAPNMIRNTTYNDHPNQYNCN